MMHQPWLTRLADDDDDDDDDDDLMIAAWCLVPGERQQESKPAASNPIQQRNKPAG
jgi:hypothetical protein